MPPKAAPRARHTIRIKRVYDPPGPQDGLRILVDRIWPRGMKKEQARVDLWLKDIAPSTDLRKWFGHDADRWGEFRKRYFGELDKKSELLRDIQSKTAEQDVTLLYAAADEQHNNARCLWEYLTHF